MSEAHEEGIRGPENGERCVRKRLLSASVGANGQGREAIVLNAELLREGTGDWGEHREWVHKPPKGTR